jgi:DNA-binding transcriptional regulator YiaG
LAIVWPLGRRHRGAEVAGLNWLDPSAKPSIRQSTGYGLAQMKNTELISEAREAVATGRASEIRQSARLSQSEIAMALGVTTSAVCKWERGTRSPRGDVAERYGRLLRRLATRTAT